MRYSLLDIPALLRTPIGRMQFLHGLLLRSTPLLYPILFNAASQHRWRFGRKTRVVVVVGSLGKSTTMRGVLAALGRQVPNRPPRNTGISLAKAILRIRPHDRHAVIEVGIDNTGQMLPYARMIRPDITVVTSIMSGEHHRLLSSLEITRMEKSEMVRILPETGIAVLNGDDPNVLWMQSQTRARVITFGFECRNDIRASDITLDWPNGTRFKLHADGKTHNIHVHLIGRHMIYPILAGVAVGLAEGVCIDRILPPLETLAPTPGRMQPVKLSNGAIILRDDYKSALETIEAALDVFSQIPAKRRIMVFGDVTEPQGRYHPILQHLGEHIAKVASRAIFISGRKGFQALKSGAKRGGLPNSALFNAGRSVLKVVEKLHDDLKAGDVVLIKGRNSQRLDRITLKLTGRTVRCDISFCDTSMTSCERCPMLERGWGGLRVVI